jgi:rod shape-determining protein MreB
MLIEAVKEILETTPPEILGDVMHRGMYLIGGGALIEGLDKIISDYTKVPVHIPEDPLTAVVRGTGVIIENLSSYQDVLIPSDEEFSN